MRLSNLRKSFLPAGLSLIVIQGCNPTEPAKPDITPPVVEVKSGFPFSLKEPEIYQGEIVIDGDETDRSFVARKVDRWREDMYRDGHLWMSELYNGRRFTIDHERKIYIEHEPAANGVESFAGMPQDFLTGKEDHTFDEVARENNIVRYKARTNKYMPDDILIDVDTASGMIVRQEFRSAAGSSDGASFVYEMRNLKLDVDDQVFALPAGFRKVSKDEFYKKEDTKP